MLGIAFFFFKHLPLLGLPSPLWVFFLGREGEGEPVEASAWHFVLGMTVVAGRKGRGESGDLFSVATWAALKSSCRRNHSGWGCWGVSAAAQGGLGNSSVSCCLVSEQNCASVH